MKKNLLNKIILSSIAFTLIGLIMPTGVSATKYPDWYNTNKYFIKNDLLARNVTREDQKNGKTKTTSVSFNNNDWYILEDHSKGTDGTNGYLLMFSATSFKNMAYGLENDYKKSKVKEYLDSLTKKGGSYYEVADAMMDTEVGKLYIFSEKEATPCKQFPFFNIVLSQEGKWWLRTPAHTGNTACSGGTGMPITNNPVAGSVVIVNNHQIDYNGIDMHRFALVRPAFKLDLSKVDFDLETKTFTMKDNQSILSTVFGKGSIVIIAVAAIALVGFTIYSISFKKKKTNNTKEEKNNLEDNNKKKTKKK